MKAVARRYYYEIHLGGAVVDGVKVFSGMLEAEKAVEERAQELRLSMQKPLRGYMIMREGHRARRFKHRM